ncbi:hypothetical protein KVY03_03705 [Epilithonimonas sp. FP105]|nr:hypothetical protein [Epilithonimonas sp. FP105]
MLIFFSSNIRSQQIEWGQINSANVIDIIAGQNPDIGTYTSTVQIGDHNSAELFINGRTSLSLSQIGDYNKVFYINSFTDAEVKNTITTQGHNNIIDITGSNSISENMKMNIKGDNTTIFMRNY